MSDSITNDTFKDTASQAEAMLEKSGFYDQGPKAPEVVTATPTITPADVPTVASSTTVEQAIKAESPSPQVPQPLDVSPDTPIKIKVNGEEKIVKASEYQEMLQRTDVFTQRQQAVARQQRDLEQQYAQKEAYLIQQAQALQRVYDQMIRQQPQNQQAVEPPKVNPQEIATIGEVQEAMRAMAQQVQQVRQVDQEAVQKLLDQRAVEVRQEFEIAQDQKRFTQEVQRVLNSPEGKMLAEVNPRAEQILRFETLQMGPQDTDQAIEFLHQYTKGWAEKVQGRFIQQQTAKAVEAAKTVMEAPLGQAPPVPSSATKGRAEEGWVD